MTKHSYFRNGKPITIDEALDRNGLIRHGVVMRTQMTAMDHQTFSRRPLIVDTNQPNEPIALHRPGFRGFADTARNPVLRHVVGDAQRQIIADERAAYVRRLQDGWKGPSHRADPVSPDHGQVSARTSKEVPMPKHNTESNWIFDENSVSYKNRLVTDASGDAYGFHRPGYRFLVDAPTTDARDEAYRDYLDDLSSAWMGKRSTDDRC